MGSSMQRDIKILAGGSTAEILRIDNIVIKTGDNIVEQYLWYDIVSSIDSITIPEVYHSNSTVLILEYIEGNILASLSTSDILQLIPNIISNIHIMREYNSIVDFSVYLSRLVSHINSINTSDSEFSHIAIEVLKLLESNSNVYNEQRSFCHGDLTAENIIIQSEDIVYIDPNYQLDSFSSWLLDCAKLYQSFHYSYEYEFTKKRETQYSPNVYELLKSKFSKYHKYILLLEASHYIRMYKYKNTNTERLNITNIIKLILEEFRLID